MEATMVVAVCRSGAVAPVTTPPTMPPTKAPITINCSIAARARPGCASGNLLCHALKPALRRARTQR